jgi:hypothetical protein
MNAMEAASVSTANLAIIAKGQKSTNARNVVVLAAREQPTTKITARRMPFQRHTAPYHMIFLCRCTSGKFLVSRRSAAS